MPSNDKYLVVPIFN